MSQHRAGSTRWIAGAVAFWCLFTGGCQTTSVTSLFHPNSPNAPLSNDAQLAAGAKSRIVVASGMVVDWDVKTAQNVPGLIKTGKGIVGPDGTLVLGPYGTCKVAGLPLDQANKAVEKHLTAYVKQPTVVLTVAMPEEKGAPLAWRPAGTGSSRPTATAANSPQGKPAPPKKANGVMPTAWFGVKDKDKEAKAPEKIETGPPPRVFHPEMPVYAAPPGTAPFVAVEPGVPHPVLPSDPDELKRIVLPSYIIGPPDVLQIESIPGKGTVFQPVRGPHLVRPDGTVGLGIYGSVLVAGLTIEQTKEVVARAIHARLDPDKVAFKDVLDYVSVDVLAFNSKVYYVITDNAGQGENVIAFPVTGGEFVLDAISKINGLPPVASKRHIWVARRNSFGHPEKILPVDWIGITQRGSTATNWQVMPGDRIYVRADRWFTADRALAKILSPFERLLGITLLGSQTANSLRSGTTGFGNSGVP